MVPMVYDYVHRCNNDFDFGGHIYLRQKKGLNYEKFDSDFGCFTYGRVGIG